MRKTFSFWRWVNDFWKLNISKIKRVVKKKICFQSHAKLIGRILINSSKLYWDKKCRITNCFCMNTSTFFADIKRDRYEGFWILKTWIWDCNCWFWCCFSCMLRFFDCLLACSRERAIASSISMIDCMIVEVWNAWCLMKNAICWCLKLRKITVRMPFRIQSSFHFDLCNWIHRTHTSIQQHDKNLNKSNCST